MVSLQVPPDPRETFPPLIEKLFSFIQEFSQLLPPSRAQTQYWQDMLQGMHRHVAEGVCRVAVVGTVKSGKSTLINSLLGQDLLKRGAGIVTAIVTRLQPAATPQAILTFKDWEEINGEINQALTFFPHELLRERTAGVDIREPDDREVLAQVLAQIDQDHLLHQDTLDKNYVLLSAYLEGFPLVREHVQDQGGVLTLNGPQILQHQQLVGHQAESVYLKDVVLQFPFPWTATGLEIGDCQGSDSPIPQHLAQVQDYLLKADLLLYVISSRIGLRQADYKFLAEIKKMRLGDNILFIINVDLHEFDTLAEAQALMERLQRELRLIHPKAAVFAFSVLDQLLHRMQTQGHPLTAKEAGKLAAWELDAATTAAFRRAAQEFETSLGHLVRSQQNQLFVSRSVSQLRAVIQGLEQSIQLHASLLAQDAAAFLEIKDGLMRRRLPLEGVMRSLSSSMQGMAEDLKKTLRKNIGTFFDARHGPIGRAIIDFIMPYQPDPSKMPAADKISHFLPGFYVIYQDFQQQLARFLTEAINLRILEFVRAEEDRLHQQWDQLIIPLSTALQDAFQSYYKEIATLGVEAAPPRLTPCPWALPKDLQPQLFSLQLHLDWKVRREAIVHLGLNLVTETLANLSKLWSKKAPAERSQRLYKSWLAALNSMKKVTQQDMANALLDYSERMKFRYFFPLVDLLVKEQQSHWTATLSSLLVDLDEVQALMGQQQDRKSTLEQHLRDFTSRLTAIAADVNLVDQQLAAAPIA